MGNKCKVKNRFFDFPKSTKNVLMHFYHSTDDILSGCKFPIVHMCQKLWKLAGSRQSYCKNKQAYFVGPPCISRYFRWKYHEIFENIENIMIFSLKSIMIHIMIYISLTHHWYFRANNVRMAGCCWTTCIALCFNCTPAWQSTGRWGSWHVYRCSTIWRCSTPSSRPSCSHTLSSSIRRLSTPLPPTSVSTTSSATGRSQQFISVTEL